jgi:hypothetical protein
VWSVNCWHGTTCIYQWAWDYDSLLN